MSVLPALAFEARAQSHIVVNPSVVITDVSRHPVGANTDGLLDNDLQRKGTITDTIQHRLEKLSAQYRRWPGGEEGNDVLWTTLAMAGTWHTSGTLPTPTANVAVQGNTGAFPNNVSTLVSTSDYATMINPYGFDKFMTDCNAASPKCKPVLMMAQRPYTYTGTGTAPSLSQLQYEAGSLAAYAKSNSYGIRYYEIGNEYWNSATGFTGAAFTQSAYESDLEGFASVIRSADSNALIGASAQSGTDAEGILNLAISHSVQPPDFIVAHPYPTWFGTSGFYTPAYSFSDYQTQSGDNFLSILPDFYNTGILGSNLSAKAKLSTKVAITETNSITGGSLSAGSTPDYLWKGMALVDTLFQQISQPYLDFTQVWTTHWTDDTTTAPTNSENVLDENNNLTPTGLALEVVGEDLLSQIVATGNPFDNTGYYQTHSYASYDPATGNLNVVIVNKSSSSQSVSVDLQNYAPSSSSVTSSIYDSTLSSNPQNDPSPQYVAWTSQTLVGNSVVFTVPAVSVVTLRFQGKSVEGLNVLQDPGFEADFLPALSAVWNASGSTSTLVSNRGVRAAQMAAGQSISQNIASAVYSSASSCTISGFGLADASTTGYIGVSGTVSSAAWKQYFTFTNLSATPNIYTKQTLTFDVPSGLSNVTFFASSDAGSTGTFYADDLFMSCGTNANLVANADFETGSLTSWTVTGSAASTTTTPHSLLKAALLQPSAAVSQTLSPSASNCMYSAFGKLSGTGLSGFAGVSGTLSGASWKYSSTLGSTSYALLSSPFYAPSGWTSSQVFASTSSGTGTGEFDQVEVQCGNVPNLVTNPGFESGLSGWTQSGSSTLLVGTPVNSGSGAAQIPVGSTALQNVPLSGSNCTLSLYGKLSVSGAIGYFGIGWTGPTAPSAQQITTTSYKAYHFEFTLPPNATYPYVYVTNSGSTGTISADDMFLSCR